MARKSATLLTGSYRPINIGVIVITIAFPITSIIIIGR
jgi:hypothetical protein